MSKIIPWAFLLLLMTSACTKHSNDVDVSGIKIDLNIKRLDQDLFSFRPDSVLEKSKQMKGKYGNFWDTYIEGIMSLGPQTGIAFVDNFKRLRADYSIQKAAEETKQAYPDLKAIERPISEALKHFNYYFPHDSLPEVYTCITGFNSSVLVDKKLIVISLEKFLGSKSEIYPRLGIENYKIYKMNPDNIPVEMMATWARFKFPYNDSITNLMTQMVYEGRIIYFLDRMLPSAPDTLKWGYTPHQLKWANKWEKKIWAYLVENKLLFTQSQNELRRYIADGPFTNSFGNFSAPRAGVFTGYKIVESFMEHNKCSLAELMNIKDYQSILVRSRYRP